MMKINVLFATLLSMVSFAYGFVPLIPTCKTFVKTHPYWRMKQCSIPFGLYRSSFPLALSSTVSYQEAESSNPSTDALWSHMEEVAEKIQTSSRTGGLFTVKDVDQQDPEIRDLLETQARVSFNTPKTLADAIEIYLRKGGGGFILASMIVTFLYRMSLIMLYPLGIRDILCFVGTRIFWEAQEWVIHSRWFHGGENLRAQPLFKSHDRHHDLPYYHVSVEPLRFAVVWWACILGLLKLSVSFLKVPTSMAATLFLSYQTSAFVYSFMHCICHSRVPLKGWFKRAKDSHIKHHMNPTHHLNMGPNNIDRLMKTDSYDQRLHHVGKAKKNKGGMKKREIT